MRTRFGCSEVEDIREEWFWSSEKGDYAGPAYLKSR